MNLANLINTIEAVLFEDICKDDLKDKSLMDYVYIYDALRDDLQSDAIIILNWGTGNG